ncbi:MAG: hypothetical protein COW62_12885 [Zetaproteobacteria bacterium CG17_big_fil_post_rev_8_21_14_2_50_50_13]|nr:MAG: hypothetical protein COW62_12885 [Zetaproteobacteria bacterium CG17_big_fil_post_rev_8_21_14_2_50_50_13]PIY56565.1 MAG: hypothetical protein COZ00_03545 [Zetaproteobacteria bacterium CG_4_10_14_0_8_um_filter_49_80]
MQKLVDYRSNVYSQFGEDGIIERIFETIGTKSKLCVEFGAWDGFHMANTANLWTKSWRGVLIEGNQRRYKRLLKNVSEYNCSCICAFVQSSGDSTLEALLDKEGVTEQIDLLSIDIDGNDYYIFESLKTIRPRVVVCEHNPTIPAEIDLVAAENNYFGCSVSALVRVGESKGYKLVAVTETNSFFVLNEYEELFAEYETRLEKIKNDRYVTYFITSYSGEYVLSKTDLAYGASFPYKGKLIGEHTRISFHSTLLRPVYDLIRKAKDFVREQLK